jgi:hypothetical protein
MHCRASNRMLVEIPLSTKCLVYAWVQNGRHHQFYLPYDIHHLSLWMGLHSRTCNMHCSLSNTFLDFSHLRKPWHGNLHRADVCVWICVDHCHKGVTCTVVLECSHFWKYWAGSFRQEIGKPMLVCGFSPQRCNMHCSLKSNTPRVFRLVIVPVSVKDELVAPCTDKM